MRAPHAPWQHRQLHDAALAFGRAPMSRAAAPRPILAALLPRLRGHLPAPTTHGASGGGSKLPNAMLRVADRPASSAEAEFGTHLHKVDPEHRAVAEYFASTLPACPPVRVRSVTRLHNAEVYRRYSCTAASGETLMFHGCKNAGNEESIIRKGFDVSCCRSGGAGYGTWLANSANYSNNGYVRIDSSGVRDIFVCVVSYHHVVRNDATMRVVGQDCAYPLWMLKYDFSVEP